MNRTRLRMAFVLIALVLTGTVFTSAFLATTNGNQVQESILLGLDTSLVADEDLGNYHVEVEAGNYSYVSLWIEKDQGIYGEFETANEAAVTFYVFDTENFDFFQLGQSYRFEEWVYDRWHGDFSFETDIADMWHFVFKTYSWDEPASVSLDLYRDTDPPVVSLNLEDGGICEGVVTITINVAEPAFYVTSAQLSIDGRVVCYTYQWGNDWDWFSSSQELTYGWNTEDYSDGSHSIAVFAEDSLGHSTEKTVVVEVDNWPTTEALPLVVSVAIGGTACIIVIVLALWRRRNGDRMPSTLEPQ